MKRPFARLVRRYVILAVCLTLLVFIGLPVLFFGVLFRYVDQYDTGKYNGEEIAQSMTEETAADGTVALDFGTGDTAERWMQGYAWAMVLDDEGNVVWSYQLPEDLEHSYTASEIADFSRWYLEEYPVFCYPQDYGLFVLACTPDSIRKVDAWFYTDFVEAAFSTVPHILLGLPLSILLVCFLFSWLGQKRLNAIADGLSALSEGKTVELPTRGFAADLADTLNRTSQQLQKRNEIIARRDNTRTSWIAGVSHDIRTPLSLILGWAEQLEGDSTLPAEARKKAGGIRTQSERLRSLIEDLNLTSKLQYGAQPLRLQYLYAGPLWRELVANFCDTPLADRCEIELTQTGEAERAVLQADKSLLARAVENLLNNSVRHNDAPIHLEVRACMEDNLLCLIIADDGRGYPENVLEALQANPSSVEGPHILGLHVVEQIAQAHGGSAFFRQNQPHGAKAELRLPVGETDDTLLTPDR